ncbi:uncharacterized protein VTP21DRAFT_7 [Calcarisporiella thermophila]|uniref:uncharacterized protein n=1 Tax=Calcarisporiella thermophila TaxID=911321 RepID=UPI003743B9B0
MRKGRREKIIGRVSVLLLLISYVYGACLCYTSGKVCGWRLNEKVPGNNCHIDGIYQCSASSSNASYFGPCSIECIVPEKGDHYCKAGATGQNTFSSNNDNNVSNRQTEGDVIALPVGISVGIIAFICLIAGAVVMFRKGLIRFNFTPSHSSSHPSSAPHSYPSSPPHEVTDPVQLHDKPNEDNIIFQKPAEYNLSKIA